MPSYSSGGATAAESPPCLRAARPFGFQLGSRPLNGLSAAAASGRASSVEKHSERRLTRKPATERASLVAAAGARWLQLGSNEGEESINASIFVAFGAAANTTRADGKTGGHWATRATRAHAYVHPCAHVAATCPRALKLLRFQLDC